MPSVSIEISFRDPRTYDVGSGGPENERPLKKGSGVGPHVHGTLSLRIGGEPVTGLGYFGDDDVCLKEWAQTLTYAAERLQSTDPSRYVHEDGEQGSPAFIFERKGASVSISIGPSEFDEPAGEAPEVIGSCGLEEFVVQVRKYLADLKAAVEEAAPGRSKKWLGKLRL